MKVAINVRAFNNRGGIGRYSRALVRHLTTSFTDDQFLLFSHPGTDISFLAPSPNWKFIPVTGSKNRVIWEKYYLANTVNAETPHVFHNPDYTAPAGIRSPIVVTVHDLSFRFFPTGVSFKARLLYNSMTPPSLKRSTLVMADSYFTRDEIVRSGWKDKNSIRVIHLAVDSKYFEPLPPDDVDEILRTYSLQRGYILYLGAIDKRKNIKALVNAYAELKSKLINIPRLVIAGENIGGESEITSLVLKLGIGNDVSRIGFVPPDHLQAIYSGARIFVFPSLYEGFGLPPLEAMACGVPVITSDQASLPEVVGDAGIVIPVDKTNLLVESMRLLLTDDNLHSEFRMKGIERAKTFTWDKVANEAMKVYREAAGM